MQRLCRPLTLPFQLFAPKDSLVMEDKGEKRILGRSSFSLLIENLSERFRTVSKESTGVWRHLNTTTTKGKRNVVLLCYALGFIGLHAVWQQSKKNKTLINENTEGEEESATTSWTSWRNRTKIIHSRARFSWFVILRTISRRTIFEKRTLIWLQTETWLKWCKHSRFPKLQMIR